jgi:hypothetical protein
MGPVRRYLTLLALAGCDPGSLYDDPIIYNDGGAFVCEQEVAVNGTGHHNEGMPCLDSGCHRNGGGPTFTVGGTMYATTDGTTPMPGATVVVIDGDGKRLELATAQNGNFWTSEPVVMPLLVKASQCPWDNPMVSLSQVGNCNQGGCHGPVDIRVALDD